MIPMAIAQKQMKQMRRETTEGQLVIANESNAEIIITKLEHALYDTTITRLKFEEIELTGSIFAKVTQLFKSGRRWDHVEFSDCGNPVTVAMILSIATVISDVKSLQYGSYKMQDNITLALSAALQANSPLQSLRLDTSIHLNAALSLGTGLSENTQITSLDLTGCEFANIDSLVAICRGFAKNTTIRTLKMSGCGFDDTNIATLVRRGLVNHPAITELWLDGNYCRNNGIEAIAEMLQSKHNKLEILSLNSQGFEYGHEKFDLSPLIEALQEPPPPSTTATTTTTTTSMTTSSSQQKSPFASPYSYKNKFSSSQQQQQKSSLSPPLSSPYSYKNKFGSASISSSPASGKTTATMGINASNNTTINTTPGSLPFGYTTTTPTLKHLDLSNNCTIDGTERLLNPLVIEQILSTNTSLQVLDISNNCLDDDDLKIITQGLRNNQTLEAIQLGSNNITEDGLFDFLDVISDMKGLKKVGFSGNLFEEFGIRMLYESFPETVSTEF